MSESKLRIKFGENEFEAEGSEQCVDRQFEGFRRLIAPEQSAAMDSTSQSEDKKPAIAWEKIMRIRGRIVSLSVAASAADAVLVLLLGQKLFRKNDLVSGGEIMDGLRESGLHIPRADTILAKHARQGTVIALGRLRLRRYRLSSDGIERAQQIARELVQLVA